MLTDVLGPALLVRACIEVLKETRGRIDLVGGVTGFVNTPGRVERPSYGRSGSPTDARPHAERPAVRHPSGDRPQR